MTAGEVSVRMRGRVNKATKHNTTGRTTLIITLTNKHTYYNLPPQHTHTYGIT